MNITLNQIRDYIIFITSLIGGILIMSGYIQKVVIKILEPINQKIIGVEIDQCKNYLVRFLADVEKGKKLSELEYQRAYDAFDKYENEYHQNGYIHDWWNRVMKKERRK